MAEMQETTHSEFVVVSLVGGRERWDVAVANSLDDAANPWAYHAETNPEEIVTVAERRVYVTPWGPAVTA